MKVFNLIFCFLFVISAGLQYNDPDPYVWIPIYMYGAVLCWLAFKNKFYPLAYIAGILVFLAYAIYLFLQRMVCSIGLQNTMLKILRPQ